MKVTAMMAMNKSLTAAFAVVWLTSATAFAQTPLNEAELIRARQDISTMEGVLERAIQNGAETLIAQLRFVMPDRWRLTSTPRASGVRLADYGVLFQVQVPALQPPIMWEVRQAVQENQTRELMLLQQLRTHASTMEGAERAELERLILETERQLALGNLRPGLAREVSAASLVPTSPVGQPQQQRIDARLIEDPQEAYTNEIKGALVDAMLKNSQGLALASEEWLTIVARDAVPPNPLLPGDSIYSSTWVMRVRGSDLAALRTGGITLEEARKRVDLREQ